jgi:hypothetical protein
VDLLYWIAVFFLSGGNSVAAAAAAAAAIAREHCHKINIS